MRVHFENVQGINWFSVSKFDVYSLLRRVTLASTRLSLVKKWENSEINFFGRNFINHFF
jgi:hypothetical protein